VFYFEEKDFTIRKLTQKICQVNGLQELPAAQSFHLISTSHDDTTDHLVMITAELSVLLIDLESLQIEELMNLQEELDKNVTKMRSYDRVICFTDFNFSSGLLTVSFANRALFSVFDVTNKKSFFWNLPKMDRARPLCVSSDLEKMVVCYDSNLITVFDLMNRTLHDWSRQNGSKFPSNFLNRYNRFIGAV